jgi:hypothetical protein
MASEKNRQDEEDSKTIQMSRMGLRFFKISEK